MAGRLSSDGAATTAPCGTHPLRCMTDLLMGLPLPCMLQLDTALSAIEGSYLSSAFALAARLGRWYLSYRRTDPRALRVILQSLLYLRVRRAVRAQCHGKQFGMRL